MSHDFIDRKGVDPYKAGCRKHSDGLVVDCRSCANYQSHDPYQPIGKITGDPRDCCNGFMGYDNHPHYWSDCSVRFFRQHYLAQNWDRCMDSTSGYNIQFILLV